MNQSNDPSVIVHVSIVNPLRRTKRNATGAAFARSPTHAQVIEAARIALDEAVSKYQIKSRGSYFVKQHSL